MNNKISRKVFLKTSTMALASTSIAVRLYDKEADQKHAVDEALMTQLLEANEVSVTHYLKNIEKPLSRQYYRNLSGGFAVLSASYCHPKSSYFRSENLLQALQQTIDKLMKLQYADGTLDSGGNRKSPPDTAFLLEPLCAAASILKSHNDFEELLDVKMDLDTFLINAGEALRTGGIHTPNHRWVVCSVLAQLFALFKNKKYLDRIDEWLAEGIYINQDGQYPERSRNYSVVENTAFMHLGDILDRPELFDPVRKNLDSTFYYMEQNGQLVALDSRRQDKYRPITITRFYRLYRYMAIRDSNGFFAAVAQKIEAMPDFDRLVLSGGLPYFMESPILSQELPQSAILPVQYSKHLKGSDLFRIKRGEITASIFGGTDKPLTVASGRATNPTFFTFRKGAAILEYARLSSSFFNMGYFRSEGVLMEGNQYVLSEKKEAYYYHPIPASERNPRGDYKLSESLDGRYWSKMNFDARPKDTLHLNSVIRIKEDNGVFKIDLDIKGTGNVEVTLELCFRKEAVWQVYQKGTMMMISF